MPEAAQQRLLRYRPATAPTRDPLEREAEEKVIAEARERFVTADEEQRERVLFQFLRDAPFLLNAQNLGAATAALTPWPHQTRVANAIIERFPERFLLCDEVGLGKTIEVGLVLRLVNVEGMRPSPTNPFYTEVQGQSREALRRQFMALRDKAAHLVGSLANALVQ